MSITFQLLSRVPNGSINVSNVNGCALLRLAGLPPTEFGEVPLDKVGAVIKNLMRAANIDDLQRQTMQSDSTDLCGRWVDLGRDRSYVIGRVNDLLGLFLLARKSACGVIWG